MSKFLKNLLVLSCVFALPSCAYVTNKSAQHVKVETPGAHSTKCIINNDGIKFKVDGGQSAFVTKSSEPLHVLCRAPGGRDREVYINPIASPLIPFSVLTGPIGPAFDIVSGAAFTYPDIVTVDFTNMEVRPEQLPEHNNPDIRQPEEYNREEYGPTRPVLNDEPRFTRVALRRRGEALGDYNGENAFPNALQIEPAGDKSAPSSSGQ